MTHRPIRRALPVALRIGSIMSAVSNTAPRQNRGRRQATAAALTTGRLALVPSAKSSGAERVIALSCHGRPSLARNLCATNEREG